MVHGLCALYPSRTWSSSPKRTLGGRGVIRGICTRAKQAADCRCGPPLIPKFAPDGSILAFRRAGERRPTLYLIYQGWLIALEPQDSTSSTFRPDYTCEYDFNRWSYVLRRKVVASHT